MGVVRGAEVPLKIRVRKQTPSKSQFSPQKKPQHPGHFRQLMAQCQPLALLPAATASLLPRFLPSSVPRFLVVLHHVLHLLRLYAAMALPGSLATDADQTHSSQ